MYTNEQANKIKILLYQFGEIAYLQFKQINNDEKEKGNTVRTCIN